MSKKGPILGTLFLLPSSIHVYMRLYSYTFEFIDIFGFFFVSLQILKILLNMIKRIFSVDGMACPHCKKRVEDALTALPGVDSAVADIDSKQVEVCFDETRVTPHQLQEAVEDCGYGFAI